LDLSPYWDKIVSRNTAKAILPQAEQIDFITVNP